MWVECPERELEARADRGGNVEAKRAGIEISSLHLVLIAVHY